MACETYLKPKQTVQQRVAEVREAMKRIDAAIVARRALIKVGPQGAISVSGLTNEERDGVTDACIYRRIMATGSALAKAAIAKAEQLAGRQVDRKVIGQGTHSHDGGHTWHGGHR